MDKKVSHDPVSTSIPSKPLAGRFRLPASMGLSAKLLVLTITFVMIAEVLIFVPSVANFRRNWLMDRLAAAQLASLAAKAAPGGQIPEMLRREMLRTVQVKSVAHKDASGRHLVLRADMPSQVELHVDLLQASQVDLILQAMSTLFIGGDRVMSVRGNPGFGKDEFVEIVISEHPLRAAMINYGVNILILSIVISIFTAALVYFALNWLLVRPMTRMMRNMVHFSDNPEDASRIIKSSDRRDEIGTAERALSHMQTELVSMLQQKNRLAALGLAVSKINHDLRNMLSSAQLISDRLSGVKDPTVQRIAPKLIHSVDRAINLCTQTLRYGRAHESPPERKRFPLKPLVDDVRDGLDLPAYRAISWIIDIPEDLEVDADPDQLFRVVSNLCRNACQVLEAQEEAPTATNIVEIPSGPGGAMAAGLHTLRGAAQPPQIRVAAMRQTSGTRILVSDTGPGVPEKARQNLFKAFRSSARKGGTGLGLAISAELVRAHGGDIVLEDSEIGTRFHIDLPDSREPG